MVVITDPSQDIKNKSEPQKGTTTDNLEQKLNAGMVGIEGPESKSIRDQIKEGASNLWDRASNAVSTFIKDKTQARGYELQDALNIREEENALNQVDVNLLSDQEKVDHRNRLYFLENKYKELGPKNIDVEKVRNLADSVLKSPTYIRVKRNELQDIDEATGLPDRKSQYKTQLLEAFQEDVYNGIDKRDRYIANDNGGATVYRAKDSNMVADSIIDAFYDRGLGYTLDHLAEYEDRIREGKDYDQDAYRELKSQISNIRNFAIYATNNVERTYDFDQVLADYMDEGNANPFVTIDDLGLMENSDVYHSRQLLVQDLKDGYEEFKTAKNGNDKLMAIGGIALGGLGYAYSIGESLVDNIFAEVNAGVEGLVSLAAGEGKDEALKNMYNAYSMFDNIEYRGIYDNLKKGDSDLLDDILTYSRTFANNIVDAGPDFVTAFAGTPRLLGKGEKIFDTLENRLFWSKASDIIKKYDGAIDGFSNALKGITEVNDAGHVSFIVARAIIKDGIIDNVLANALLKGTSYREYTGVDLSFDVGSSILIDGALTLLKIRGLPLSKEGNIFKAELVKKAFNISDWEWSGMGSDTKDELGRIATSMIDVATSDHPNLKEIVDKTTKYVEKKYKTAEAGIEGIINNVNKRSNNILIWASKDSKRKQYITQDQYGALTLKTGMSFNDMLTMRKDYDNKIMQYWKKVIAEARGFKTEGRNGNYMQQLLDAYKQQSNVIDGIKSAITKFKELKADEKANTLSDIKMVMSKWEREMFDIRKTKNNVKDAKNADEEYTQLQTFKFHIAEMKKMYIQASLERSRIVRNNLKSEDLRGNTVATAWKRNAYNGLKSGSATGGEIGSVSKLDRMGREFIMEDNININGEEYFNKIFDHLKGSLDDDMVDLLLYTDRDIYNNRKENSLNLLNIDYSSRKFFSNPVEVAYFVGPKGIIESTIDPNINLKYRYRGLNRSGTRAIFELTSDDIDVPNGFRFEITAEGRMYISDWNLFRDILGGNGSWVEFKSALNNKDGGPTPDTVTPEERDQFNKDFSESAYLPTSETNRAIDETIANELDGFETSVTEGAKADNNPEALELKENQEEAHDAVTDNVEAVQEADPNQEKVKWKTKIEKGVRSLLDLLKKDYGPYWEADGEFKIEDLEGVNFNSYDEDIEAFPTLRSMIDGSTYQKLLDKYNGEGLDLAKKKARLLGMVNMLVGGKGVYVDGNGNITFSLKGGDVRDGVSRPFVRKNWHQDFDVYIGDRGTFVTYSAETKSSAEEVAFNKRRRGGPNSQADKYLDIHVQEYEKTGKTWRGISRLKEDNPEEKILEAYKATGNGVEGLVVRGINHDRTAWHVNGTITFIRDADVKDVEVIMKEQLDVSNIDNIKNYFSNWLGDTKELDRIKNANTAQEIILEGEKRGLITNIDNNIVGKLNELYDNLRGEAIEIWAQKIAKKYSGRFDVNTISDTLTPYYMVDRTNINNLLDEFNTRYPSAIIGVEKGSPENYRLMNMVNKGQQFKERRGGSRNYRRSVSGQLHVSDNELREVGITDEELRQIAKNRLNPNNYRAKDIDVGLKNKLNKIADNKCKLIRDKINNFIKLEIETISIRDQGKKKAQELHDIGMRKPKETRVLGREIIQIAVDYNNRINQLDNIIKDIGLSNDVLWAQSSVNRGEQYISSLRHMKEWHQNFIDRNYHLIFGLPTTISEAGFKETIDVPSKPKKVPVQEALPLADGVKDPSEKFEIKVKDDSLDIAKEQKTGKTLSSLGYQSDILGQGPGASSNVDSKEFVRIVTTLKDFILNNGIDNVIVRFGDAAWIAMTTAARLARLENPKITITQYLTDKKRYQEVMENLALGNQSKFVWNSDAVYNYAELHRKESSTVINNQMFEDIVGNSDYVFTFDWGSNFNDYQYIKNKVGATPVDLHSKFANGVNSLRVYGEGDEFISKSPVENIDAIIKKFESESPTKSTTISKGVSDKLGGLIDEEPTIEDFGNTTVARTVGDESVDNNNYEVVTDEGQKPATDIFENATEVKDNEAQNIIVDDVVEQFAETKTVTPNYIDSLGEGGRGEFSPGRVDELVKVKSGKIDKELEVFEIDTNGKFGMRSYALRMNDLLKKDKLVSKDIQSKLIEYETSGKDFGDPDFELFLSCADVLALANGLPIYNGRFAYYKEKYNLKDGVSRVILLKNILNDVHKNYGIITITKDGKIFLSDKDNMIQKKYKEYGEILSGLDRRIDYMSRGMNYGGQVWYINKLTQDVYNTEIVPEIEELNKKIIRLQESLEEMSNLVEKVKNKEGFETIKSTDMYNKLEQIEDLKRKIEELKDSSRWEMNLKAKEYDSFMKKIEKLTESSKTDDFDEVYQIAYSTTKNPDYDLSSNNTNDVIERQNRKSAKDRGYEDVGDDDEYVTKVISNNKYGGGKDDEVVNLSQDIINVYKKYTQRMADVNSNFKRISNSWIKIRDKFYGEGFGPMKNLTEEEQKSLSKFGPLKYWSIAGTQPVIFFTRESGNPTTIKKVLPTWYRQFVNALVLTNTPEDALYSKSTIDLKKFLQLEKTSIQKYAMQQQDMDALLDSYYYDLNYDVSNLKGDDLKEQQKIIDKLKKYQDKANEIIDDMIKKGGGPKTEEGKDIVLRSVLTELLVHNPPKIGSYELEIPESLIDYKFNGESNSLKGWKLPDKLYKNAIGFKQVSYALDSNMGALDKSVMGELLNNLNNPNGGYVLIYGDNVNGISQIEKNLIDLGYEPVTNQSYDYAPIMNKEGYLYRPKKPSKEDFLKQADEIERVDNFIQSNSAQGCK